MSRLSSTLTSKKNPLLQSIRRAAAAGRATENGLIVAEGPHLIEEALRGLWTIEQVILTPAARERHSSLLRRIDAQMIEVSARAFESVAATETTQEVLALLRPRAWNWADLVSAAPLIVVLDGIQDPGNAGTIVRSAEAFGATGVVLLTGCVHVANGKFLRATAGSIFRVPFLQGWQADAFVTLARDQRLKLYGLAQRAANLVTGADLRSGCALVVGSEGRGISPELADHVLHLSIPTVRVESLNAAVACSIALFEARRQRSRDEPV
jgi:RNA methyltransferase, TrmH family